MRRIDFFRAFRVFRGLINCGKPPALPEDSKGLTYAAVIRYIALSLQLPPFQGEGWGGDGVDNGVKTNRQRQPHPPPNLPLERGGVPLPPWAAHGVIGAFEALA